MTPWSAPWMWVALGFFAGSFPTAFVAGRLFAGTDIRRHGSGNVGATNAFRVLGRKIGFSVFALDFAKGALSVWAASRFAALGEAWLLAVGIAAILGHVFTPFLGFRGGKGVATGSGVVAALFPGVFLIAVLSWAAVFWGSRIVSLSSLVAVTTLPLGGLFLAESAWSKGVLALMCLFSYWTHRDNIRRLLKGEEKKLVNRQ